MLDSRCVPIEGILLVSGVPTSIRCFCTGDPTDVFHESGGFVLSCCSCVCSAPIFVVVEGSMALSQVNTSVVLAVSLAPPLFTGSPLSTSDGCHVSMGRGTIICGTI